jgi:amidophosphoribosyltransferase
MCGIVGIVATTEVAPALYDGLTVLQHRGQDAAGIATADGSHLRVHKGNGLVRDVFDAKSMLLLQGRVGIAHCRYPTAGNAGADEAQPFYVNSPYGIALAHNGNLINTDALHSRHAVHQAVRPDWRPSCHAGTPACVPGPTAAASRYRGLRHAHWH